MKRGWIVSGWVIAAALCVSTSRGAPDAEELRVMHNVAVRFERAIAAEDAEEAAEMLDGEGMAKRSIGAAVVTGGFTTEFEQGVAKQSVDFLKDPISVVHAGGTYS